MVTPTSGSKAASLSRSAYGTNKQGTAVQETRQITPHAYPVVAVLQGIASALHLIHRLIGAAMIEGTLRPRESLLSGCLIGSGQL